MSNMDVYLCSYRIPGVDPNLLYFKCSADDNEHALEQLMDAEPTAYDVFCEVYNRHEEQEP